MTNSATIERLRSWGSGMYATEAAAELIIRAYGGRFTSPGYPWIGRSAAGSVWLDAEQMTGHTDQLSGGERRVLAIVQSLATAAPVGDLGGILAGVDRDNLTLILAALAHAGGSHEHVTVHISGTGMSYLRLPALVEWPADQTTAGNGS